MSTVIVVLLIICGLIVVGCISLFAVVGYMLVCPHSRYFIIEKGFARNAETWEEIRQEKLREGQL